MPVETDAQLCNRSLRLIGAEPISSLDDDSKVGQTLRLLYPMVRDRLLADQRARWGFATKRQSLASVVVENYTKFQYTYSVPTDPRVLVPLKLLNSAGIEFPDLDYLIEGDVVYCDLETPTLVYLTQITNTKKFPEHFINALQLLLAAEISYALDGNVRGDLVEQHKMAMHTAIKVEATSNRPRKKPSSSWVDVRRT